MILVTIILSLVSSLAFAASFCDHYQVPKAYSELNTKITEKIESFARNKVIAKKADEILSKLISAKSPVIRDWLDKRNLGTKSENEIIREWRTYYARNFILNKYPQESAIVNQEIEALVVSVNDLFASETFKKKMQDLFARSKTASLLAIKGFAIKENQKKQILARIEALELYWMKDFKASKFKTNPLDFLEWGIAYDPEKNEINMGTQALAYGNDETYLAVFSHEIGHSFDSCRWGAFFEGPWPFQGVGECLRTAASVGAQKRDDSKLESFVKDGKISADLALALKMNPTCNKAIYPTVGTQADQLPETFSDWFSAEVMSDIKDLNWQNLRTDLCEKKDLVSGSSYVSNELRLEKIYFAQPKIRALRGGSEPRVGVGKHCGF